MPKLFALAVLSSAARWRESRALCGDRANAAAQRGKCRH
jgi:hypothetical protein